MIIADTKFEFGRLNGQIILADEVLTPDSSRFWPGDEYAEGKDQPSFDKQFVRDWLNANWDRQGNLPRLPQDIIDAPARSTSRPTRRSRVELRSVCLTASGTSRRCGLLWHPISRRCR